MQPRGVTPSRPSGAPGAQHCMAREEELRRAAAEAAKAAAKRSLSKPRAASSNPETQRRGAASAAGFERRRKPRPKTRSVSRVASQTQNRLFLVTVF